MIAETLGHSGVKGMKWGVRKRSARRQAADYKTTVPLRNRKTQELSNKQIQKVNARINLEQKYTSLNPSKVKIGANAAKGVLAAAGTAAAAYNLINSPAGKAAVEAGKKFAAKKL